MRLPLSVVGGYLGAGKTTLINQVLTAEHGLRLAVLVNDFGAINIDASLLKSASEDTIELTNGCVCCTMSGDLFYAIGDILDRPNRPDHLIVEASGIADPARIAQVALAEPDLRYAGILTVVDGLNFAALMEDAAIAPQLRSQVACADLVAVSKGSDGPVRRALAEIGVPHWVASDDPAVQDFLLTPEGLAPPEPNATPHPDYVRWSLPDPAPMTREAIAAKLASAPKGVLRVKALIPGEGALFEAHLVGPHVTIETRPPTARTGVVALGLGSVTSAEAISRWWEG